ncbi:MAG: GntR family transcriptional regulator [Anaerolineae bacterium]|nr:GntR family transcriptional regulator [Anaerolineae bacterium]
MPDTTRQDLVYNSLKERIMNLTYRPGQPLVEVELADEFGVSRTPIREALQRLENEGMLVNAGRRGRVVYTLSIADTRELFDIKTSIEALVSRRAAERASESQIAAMRRALEDMRAAAAQEDVDVWFQADKRFHDHLFDAAAMPRAQELVRTLNEKWHRLRVGYTALGMRMHSSLGEHQAIMDAIANRDPDAAARVTADHLERVGKTVVDMLEKVVLPFIGDQNGQ